MFLMVSNIFVVPNKLCGSGCFLEMTEIFLAADSSVCFISTGFSSMIGFGSSFAEDAGGGAGGGAAGAGGALLPSEATATAALAGPPPLPMPLTCCCPDGLTIMERL